MAEQAAQERKDQEKGAQDHATKEQDPTEQETERKAKAGKKAKISVPKAENRTPEARPEKLVGTAKIPERLLGLVERPRIRAGQVVTESRRVRRGSDTVEEEVPVLRAVRADEVFAWREFEDHVVVVTTDGQKFVGQK